MISVGKHTYHKRMNITGLSANLTIGKYCSIAADVMFGPSNHNMTTVSTYPFDVLMSKYAKGIRKHPTPQKDIIIGNDVWIGEKAVIMAGVTIGDGAVVGTRAVVTHDVYPYGIVVGVPAKLVRDRFSPEIIRQLLSIEWWNWPEETLFSRIPDLLSLDVKGFCKKYA